MTPARTIPILAIAALGLGLGLTACDSGSGAGQRTKGDVKEAVGAITGDEDLRREGQKDQVVGGAKETLHDAKDAIEDAVK